MQQKGTKMKIKNEKAIISAIGFIMFTALFGYGGYATGLEEGKETEQSKVSKVKEEIIDIQEQLRNVCYESTIDKETKQHLRHDLDEKIQTFYENAECEEESCSHKILWIHGCLAKVRYIKGNRYMDIGMSFYANMNNHTIGWELIEGSQTEEYTIKQTTRAQRITNRTKRLVRKGIDKFKKFVK